MAQAWANLPPGDFSLNCSGWRQYSYYLTSSTWRCTSAAGLN